MTAPGRLLPQPARGVMDCLPPDDSRRSTRAGQGQHGHNRTLEALGCAECRVVQRSRSMRFVSLTETNSFKVTFNALILKG